MAGTSARIGEVLAMRKRHVDVTVSPATVRICGTVVSPKGKPTYRQHHPKTRRSTRTVSVPSFAADERVGPRTAEILESLAPREADDDAR